MTTELDALPESVRDAYSKLNARIAVYGSDDEKEQWEIISAGLLRLTARVQELERDNEGLCEANSILASANDTDFARAQNAESELAAAQAKIDALMLEYCHDEMTDEQCDAWSKRQKVAPLPLDDEAKS